MPTRHTTHHRHAPKTPEPPAQSDKKAHTAVLGVVLIILTNYQAEVKQLFSFLLKAGT
jgi:hypothetical protein